MKLNFTNLEFLEKSLNTKLNENIIHNPHEAFMILINGIEKEELDNLCNILKIHFKSSHNISLSLNDCYKLTQNSNIEDELKKTIYELAQICINKKIHLGNKIKKDYNNKSSEWISHAEYMSQVCYTLAESLNLNKDAAKTLGLLHDYGRKFTHNFSHTIKGYEELTKIGWNNEAICCLTHSFINGGRCANNEKAINGFYIDDFGNPKFDKIIEKDDISCFLENYKYTEYDLILNMADLMATSDGITSPYERIKDIATRRNIDPTNRAYFFAELINLQLDFLYKLGITNKIKHIKATKSITLYELDKTLKKVSEIFYNTFIELSTKNISKKI